MESLVDQLCNSCLAFADATGTPSWMMAAKLAFLSGAISDPNAPIDDPSIEYVRSWLHELVEERHFDEEFIAVGLARRLEDEFERVSEDYASSLKRRRDALELSEKLGRETPEQIESAKNDPFVQGSLEDMKRQRYQLTEWQRIAAPLLQKPAPRGK